MRVQIIAMAGLLVVTLFVGNAQSEELQNTEPYTIVLHVGEIFNACIPGVIICPVTLPLCDDLKVVDVVETPEGLAFKGISPGTTLCSLRSENGLRRVFRVTVR